MKPMAPAEIWLSSQKINLLVLQVALLAGVMLLGGCGGDEPKSAGGTVDAAASDGAADGQQADTAAPVTSGTFIALTYNVKGLPDAITGWDTADHMKQISPLLNGFDLIGIQEDFVAANHAHLAKDVTLTHKDWYSDKLPATKDVPKAYGSGLALFSHFPALKTGHTHYAGCVGIFDHASDCLASKGVMFTRIALSDHPDAVLDVYNTHMEAGGGKEDNAVRAEQVDHVIKLIEENSKGHAVLFMGDTNLRPSKAVDKTQIDKLDKAAGLVDACAAVTCPETNHIDRFHFRSGDKVKLTATSWKNEKKFIDDKGKDLSDHPAISTHFTWKLK
ncbi:MAG: hypothetical protein KC502_12160 [Myxococcales bacterium]|nr:hypothetical protein [Myxococcales bacterium]